MTFRTFAALLALTGSALASGCAGDFDGDASDLVEDTGRKPFVVRVPVRFTRNDLADVGFFFSSSWVPFTNVKKQAVDGYAWAAYSSKKATLIAEQIGPDQSGAGYATAWFLIEIPYAKDGELAYPLARVKLESEFIHTEIVTTALRKYSALRARRGSDQPCLSITVGGALDGKLKAISLPFEDEGFTEREWKLGDVDASGVLIEKVIVGTLRLQPVCWPENVEGDTHVAAGVAAGAGPASGFLMVDNSSGQAAGDFTTLYINLVQNEKGEVSLGELFSTSATILRPGEVAAFDQAARVFHDDFVADADRYYQDYLDGLGSYPPY
jgi:hypothetical protein